MASCRKGNVIVKAFFSSNCYSPNKEWSRTVSKHPGHSDVNSAVALFHPGNVLYNYSIFTSHIGIGSMPYYENQRGNDGANVSSNS